MRYKIPYIGEIRRLTARFGWTRLFQRCILLTKGGAMMLNSLRLWVKRYMRHIALAISIGISLAALGILLPVLRITLLVIFILSFVVSLIIGFWYQIPLLPIQQSKNPDKWITAEIKRVDNSQYLMFYGVSPVDYVDLVVELKSELPFAIEFSFLTGVVIINGNETHSALEVKSSIKLPKGNSCVIETWRLNGWSYCIKGILGRLKDRQITIQAELLGEDNKHRRYKLVTNRFNYGV